MSWDFLLRWKLTQSLVKSSYDSVSVKRNKLTVGQTFLTLFLKSCLVSCLSKNPVILQECFHATKTAPPAMAHVCLCGCEWACTDLESCCWTSWACWSHWAKYKAWASTKSRRLRMWLVYGGKNNTKHKNEKKKISKRDIYFSKVLFRYCARTYMSFADAFDNPSCNFCLSIEKTLEDPQLCLCLQHSMRHVFFQRRHTSVWAAVLGEQRPSLLLN